MNRHCIVHGFVCVAAAASILCLTAASGVLEEANAGRDEFAQAGADTTYLPPDSEIRTSCFRTSAAPHSLIATGPRYWEYFADAPDTLGYIYEGYLILGNSAENLSYLGSGSHSQGGPTPSNPFGYLLRDDQVVMSVDSTSSPKQGVATGSGYNRDSTLKFDISWYASKYSDSCDFLFGAFKIYKGPNGGTVTGLTVAYFVDWDIPADTGADNYGGVDAAKSMLYQRGSPTGSVSNNASRYGAMVGLSEHQLIVGGFVLESPIYIYSDAALENDSIWNRMSILQQNQYQFPAAYGDPLNGSGAAEDLCMVSVLARNQTIDSDDTLNCGVILASQPSGGSLAALKFTIDKAIRFGQMRNLVPGAFADCKCGDADNNGIWTISDAVYLISYIFGGGPAPLQVCLGDADGNKVLTISDAVYMITFVFGGGPAPSGC